MSFFLNRVDIDTNGRQYWAHCRGLHCFIAQLLPFATWKARQHRSLPHMPITVLPVFFKGETNFDAINIFTDDEHLYTLLSYRSRDNVTTDVSFYNGLRYAGICQALQILVFICQLSTIKGEIKQGRE